MADIKINTKALQANKQWVRHKVKDGTSTYRILPPHGESNNGYPYRRWSLVWGLNDPESGRMRPFVSTRSTEKKCPVSELVNGLQEIADINANELKAQGQSKDIIKERNFVINKVISDLRPKNIFLYNAVDQTGSVGILEVKTTAHDELKKLMMGYINDYGQDPTSLNSADDDSGVWFNFTRAGLGFDTKYTVAKKQTQQKINGQLVFVDDRTALSENVVNNYDDLAYDIHNMYKIGTYDELKAILIANLTQFSNCPEVLQVATNLGFLTDTLNVENTISTGSVDENVSISTTAAPAKKVTLNLGNQGDETPIIAVGVSTEDDEIFKMADDILNS